MADIHAKLQEEKILRSIRAKRRFRAAVRHVIHNLSWIQDDDEERIDLDNIKKTVTRFARKKKAGKGLSIREKAVLRKQIDYRTDDEKKLLNKYIGGMKCFRPYPENVQLELVGVTYFEYYEQGRVLVKQDHEAHAMYFLLSGEVIVTKTQWDEIANEFVEVELGKISAGSMFGEVSLLHNVPRTATVATVEPCELLVLKKEDFDRVLKASLMQLWDEIREAMTKFVYFSQWEDVAIRECCMLSTIKTYEQNQVIFGDRNPKKGAQVMSYFVIEGRCAIVEHLFIEETVKRGIKCYKLYDLPDLIDLPAPCAETLEEIQDKRTVSYGGKLNDTNEKVEKTKVNDTEEGETETEQLRESVEEVIRQSESVNKSIAEAKMSKTEEPAVIDSELNPKRRIETMSIMTYKSLLKKELQTCEDSIYQQQCSRLPSNVTIRFMQICTLGAKASFMQGDLMKNRRVIALTPVKILLIPAYWLMHHNRGNVWTRVEQFLNRRIPSRQSVFKAYVSSKKWQDHKRNLRNDILSQRKFYNNTTIHDVPYSIRVVSNYE